jgi:hypothetical protein
LVLIATVVVILGSAALWAQSPKPISATGLKEALKIGGLQQGELVELIKQRGVDFELTPDVETELKSAGANADVLAAVRANYRGIPSASTQPPTTTSGPSNPVPDRSARSDQPVVTSIRQVKKLYIEKMSNDLDTYIKYEISRQMPNRLAVVLQKDDADAVMAGTATTRSGTVTITDLRGKVQLWTGETGDRGLLPKMHGGEKEIAKKLVSSLKRSME